MVVSHTHITPGTFANIFLLSLLVDSQNNMVRWQWHVTFLLCHFITKGKYVCHKNTGKQEVNMFCTSCPNVSKVNGSTCTFRVLPFGECVLSERKAVGAFGICNQPLKKMTQRRGAISPGNSTFFYSRSFNGLMLRLSCVHSPKPVPRCWTTRLFPAAFS